MYTCPKVIFPSISFLFSLLFGLFFIYYIFLSLCFRIYSGGLIFFCIYLSSEGLGAEKWRRREGRLREYRIWSAQLKVFSSHVFFYFVQPDRGSLYSLFLSGPQVMSRSRRGSSVQ